MGGTFWTEPPLLRVEAHLGANVDLVTGNAQRLVQVVEGSNASLRTDLTVCFRRNQSEAFDN